MSAASGERTGRVGVGTKVAYAVGALPFGMKDVGVSTFLLLFYNQVIGLPAGLVGAALAIALISDSLVDPLIGHASDNWRSPLGRRHPFMYLAAALVGVLYFFLWSPPTGWPQWAQLAYLTVMIIAVRTAIALYEVPNSALTAELTENYDERTRLVSYQYLMAYGGGIVGVLTAYKLFLQPDATHPVGQLNPNGYRLMGLAHGLIMMAVMFACALGTQRHMQQVKSQPPRPRLSPSEIIQDFRETLSNRSLLMLMASGALSSLALGISGGTNVYMMTFLWQLSSDQIAGISLFLFAGIATGAFAGPFLGRAVGKRNALVLIGAVYIVIHSTPVLARLTGYFPTNDSPLLVPTLTAFMCAGTALMVMYSTNAGSMLADVVEDVEVKTGRRSEGVIFSAKLFMQKCVSGLGVFAAGLVVSAVSFPVQARPDAVDEGLLYRFAGVTIGSQAVFFTVALVFLGGYQITRARHQQNLERIASRAVAATPEAEPPVTTTPQADKNVVDAGATAAPARS